MGAATLRLRWSWRDLRARWLQVLAIGLIIALGTGIYAALGSTATWRRLSNDASFARTGLHDLKARLTSGTTAGAGELEALVAALASASSVERAEERLVWPAAIEVDTPGRPVLVTGELVGTAGDATIDTVVRRDGAADGEALLDVGFARARQLPREVTVRLAGGAEVRTTGTGIGPEYFWKVPDGGALTFPGDMAVVFLPLDEAQRLAGQPGRVNDVVVRLAPRADADALARELSAALSAAGIAADVTTRDEEPAHRVLYEDIDNDQKVWNLISVLVLLGASFAAFNLVTRIVEAQRRELGIGMALGDPPAHLALRPLLVGLQIAVLGTLAGIGVGVVFAGAMQSFLDQALPLPEWRTPFQLTPFLQAAALGLVLPVVATVVPVWRAVRVPPVDAIRSGHGASMRRGWSSAGARLRWPRHSVRQYPLRNLLRAPRRTLLTALAIGAAVTVLVGVLGMLDSFSRLVADADRELTTEAPERVSVQLATFQSTGSEAIESIRADPAVGRVSAGLLVPAALERAGADDVQVLLEVLPDDAPWHPTVLRGHAAGPGEVLLAEKAARDLGVEPGGTVVLRHPVRDGLGYRMVTSELVVGGVHGLPLRSFAYAGPSAATLMHLDGVTNHLQVLPAAGVGADAVQRAVVQRPGVSSAQLVGDAASGWEEMLAQFTGILRVTQGAIVALALLIAYNASSIGIDERAREHATMLAFGVRPRTVVGMAVVESVVVGVLGTLLGLGVGYLVLRWIFESLLPSTMPELWVVAHLAPSSIVSVVVLGVAAVALAPLLNARKVRRTDVPAALRIVE